MSLIRRRMMMAKEPDIPDNPTEELDYLTIVPLHDSVEEYLIYPYRGTDDIRGQVYTQDMPFYYRINGGEWIEVNLPDSENLVFRINLSKGSEMQLKCMGCNFSWSWILDCLFFRINSSANHAVKGTPMSLWYGDDFKSANSTLMEESSSLFANDIGLTAILNPKTFLPCTNLNYGCYENMFSGCSNLLHAPELPATTLAVSCYYRMFTGCTKLSYIKMLATDISENECLDSWVYGVSPTGTFVKSKDATWDTTPGALGDSGVPAGWTVVNDGEESNPLNVILNINANNGEEGVRVYNYISEKAPWISSAFDNFFIEGLYEGSMISAKVISAVFIQGTLVLSYEGQGAYDVCSLSPDGYLELVFND